MNRCVIIIIALLAVIFPATVLAQAPSGSAVPISEDDAVRLRALIDQMRQQASPAPASSSAKPTAWADVADKAIDKTFRMLEGSVSVVSDTLKKTAPELWRIMIRQQYANAARNMLEAFLYLLVGILGLLVCVKYVTKPDTEDLAILWFLGTRMLPATYLTICALVQIDAVADAVQRVINPEYYALQDLVRLILK